MPFYVPKKTQPFALGGMVLRGVALLLRLWWLVALAAFLVWPKGPHLRIEYTFIRKGGLPVHQECVYFGARGTVRIYDRSRCPLVLVIDVSNRATGLSRLIPER